MPTYEYRCRDCQEPLEVVQSIHDSPLTLCPACGGTLRKVFGNVGVVFKGSGFYRTDNRGKPKSFSGAEPSKSESAKSESSKSESSKSESAKSESSKSSSNAESSKSEPAKTKPAKTEPAQSRSAQSGSAKSGPAKVGSG